MSNITIRCNHYLWLFRYWGHGPLWPLKYAPAVGMVPSRFG